MKISLSKTKTSFHQNSNRRPIRTFLLLAGVSLLLLFFAGRLFAESTAFFVEPLRGLTAAVDDGVGSMTLFLKDKEELVRENSELETRLAELLTLQDRMSFLEAENAALQGVESDTQSEIRAGVIVRPPETPYDTLLVDKGSRDGVREGAVVKTTGAVVIGSVAKVFQDSALITLVSTPGVRSSAYIYGPDIFTYTEGQGGGVLRVTVPQGIQLEVGNVAVLPGVPGRLYGSVRHVEAPDSSPGQYGFITSEVPLQSLNIVSIEREPYERVGFDEARAAVDALQSEMFMVEIPEAVLVEEATTTPSSGE